MVPPFLGCIMLDNKVTLEKVIHSEDDETDIKSSVSVFIKVIKIRLNGAVRKHFSINEPSGKTLAFIDSKEAAIFYCMSNNLEYCFVN